MAIDRRDAGTLEKVQATLLMPLWARAVESHREKPLLRDRKAAEIVESMDYDFDRFRRKSVPVAEYCVRASVVDRLVHEMLAEYPGATIVELGVGLDARYERLDNGTAKWFELDLPDVMRLRKRFFTPHERRRMVGASLMEEQWQQDLMDFAVEPILFVAEGVLYFLPTAQVRQLLARLLETVPHGRLVFDAQSPMLLRFSNWRHPMEDSRLEFALASPREMESWDARLRVEKYVGFGDSPYYDGMMDRISWVKRWGRRLFPPSKHLFKVVQIRW